ncbi:fibronectin type III domain-containing protein [Chryseobacterium sp. 52]|uniref:fibronectin type III domain-containing protein n=1 Tax=Chryseobacterium sp. 52 TaxID=2035213 RepID=UPI00117F818B|nr:fibronectin type III domain-containing protein [Chryseobacterium sp. 52]
MKNKLHFVFSAVMALAIVSCGGGDSDEIIVAPNPSVPTAPEKKITLGTTGEIFPTTAIFRGSIVQQNGEGETPGFVYSTSPNPTMFNNKSVSTFAHGSVNYEAKAESLEPNTTYYVRGYIRVGEGKYTYTSESTFKTTGYYGPAGGHVGYDKGEYKDGWRYMEIHPTGVYYGNSAVGTNWGDLNLFISGTYPDFGKGLENTTIIASQNPGANCAAKLCNDLVRSGFSDWFLPSSQELVTLARELRKANISLASGASLWSSTQKSDNSAYDITYMQSGQIEITDIVKPHTTRTLPVRRY